MPKAPTPFSKWDPDGDEASAAAYARAVRDGQTEPEARRTAHRRANAMLPDELAGKRWLLRWAWLVSTGTALLGYAIIAILLTGHGHWLGL